MTDSHLPYTSAESLAKVNSGVISKLEHPLTIGEVEHALLERYPREDAEAWDRMGLLVGDPSTLVSHVLVALDPTFDVLDAAQSSGSTLVLTHHPVFLDPPTEFLPLSASTDVAGTIVSQALLRGISLMNIHTALDCAPEAQHMLPSLLNLTVKQTLEPFMNKPGKGYGALCTLPDDETMRLDHLAARCLSVFGATPRVWGAPNEKVSSVAVMNGSAGSVIDICIQKKVDCLICGELRYHQALDAHQRGLTIIELGHDVSELPLTALLAQAVMQIGISPDKVFIYEQSPHWFIPDAIRA